MLGAIHSALCTGLQYADLYDSSPAPMSHLAHNEWQEARKEWLEQHGVTSESQVLMDAKGLECILVPHEKEDATTEMDMLFLPMNIQSGYEK